MAEQPSVGTGNPEIAAGGVTGVEVGGTTAGSGVPVNLFALLSSAAYLCKCSGLAHRRFEGGMRSSAFHERTTPHRGGRGPQAGVPTSGVMTAHTARCPCSCGPSLWRVPEGAPLSRVVQGWSTVVRRHPSFNVPTRIPHPKNSHCPTMRFPPGKPTQPSWSGCTSRLVPASGR